MPAKEGVFGVSIMIESDRFPLLFLMTFLAFRPKVESMNIVFLMAGITVGRCLVLIERACVASAAGSLSVVALQRICGVTIMLKEHEFPIPFGVTALALVGKLSLMLVVLLVAGVAISRSLLLVQVPLMAGLTSGGNMPSP